jgi:AraC-like DNA-binding protein
MTAAPDVERLASLRSAKDLMDRAYAEPLDLDALAREAGYSRFHFARSFRDTYGLTPRVYLSARRVERARELLRTANLTVTEICYLVGFSSLGSFSARFKSEVGLSRRSPSAHLSHAERSARACSRPTIVVGRMTSCARKACSSSRSRPIGHTESRRYSAMTRGIGSA